MNPCIYQSWNTKNCQQPQKLRKSWKSFSPRAFRGNMVPLTAAYQTSSLQTTVQIERCPHVLFICLTYFPSSRCYCFQHSASPSLIQRAERVLTKVIDPPVSLHSPSSLPVSICTDGSLPHSTWRLDLL